MSLMSEMAQTVDVDNLPAEQGVAKLLEQAIQMGASDLFIAANEQHTAVMVKLLGIMRHISIMKPDQGKRYMSHLRAAAQMDIMEHRRPSDGRWIYKREEGDAVDLRISTIPTLYGEDMTCRLIGRHKHLQDLDSLGLTQDQSQRYLEMLDSPAGLILVCGPVGSGKTTTLYASLRRLNNGERKINTIEDPVEYAVENLRQSQVNSAVHLGFAELLRSVLRQAPDVVMIGEIRDPETAEAAVRAANAGMLVLATIHASSSAGAVQSMRALGAHPHFLATALRGAVAQRLARTLCPVCRQAVDLSDAPHTFDEIRPWLSPGEGTVLYAPRGCSECRMSGYAGQTGIYEVLGVSRGIRNLISENRPTREIRVKAAEEKMLEFRQAALLKVARGMTSVEEVFRVIPTEHLVVDD